MYILTCKMPHNYMPRAEEEYLPENKSKLIREQVRNDKAN